HARRLTGVEERPDARQVGLDRQDLKVEHYLDVLGPGVGNAGGPRRFGQVGRPLRLRDLDAAFDVADRPDVLVQLALVAGAELPAEPGDALGDAVEAAAVSGVALGGGDRIDASAVAEEALEHVTGVLLERNLL